MSPRALGFWLCIGLGMVACTQPDDGISFTADLPVAGTLHYRP